MRKLLAIVFLLSITACKKKTASTPYSITLTITGNGSYNYQIGTKKASGKCTGTQTINGTANIGDYIELDATADNLQNSMCTEIDVNPMLTNGNSSSCGVGTSKSVITIK